ncbi:MAG: acyltransferase [bacterium]|nr:acyltransferase [bacterium]
MKRNYGIDLLRIIAMLMIPILHILGQGGILATLPKLSIKYELAWLLETACYCAVNCFALISGYVGINTKFKYYRGLVLWLQVIFYTLLITAIFTYTMPNAISGETWMKAITPFSSRQYWYFTAYLTLFLFIPFINLGIHYLSLRQLKALGITIIATFSIWETFSKNDMFMLGNGYSFVWLTALYILGAIIQKTEFGFKLNKITLFFTYSGCIFISWFFRRYFSLHPVKELDPNLLISYISPTILIAAISLLLLCSKLTFKSRLSIRLIKFFSPLAFSVYLIHVHPLIWYYVFNNRFIKYCSYSGASLMLYVLLTALAIFFLCTTIDFIRQYLFGLLRINTLCKRLLSFTETKETSSSVIAFTTTEEEPRLQHTGSVS